MVTLTLKARFSFHSSISRLTSIGMVTSRLLFSSIRYSRITKVENALHTSELIEMPTIVFLWRQKLMSFLNARKSNSRCS